MTVGRHMPTVVLLVAALAARAVAQESVVIDMPPPPGLDVTYQEHQNGDLALGTLALQRYAGARAWPRPTSPGWGPVFVQGRAWVSSFPPYRGGWSFPGYRWSWGWGGWAGCWWGWPRYGVWGYPHWGAHTGRFVPARAVRPVRSTTSSFRRAPYGGG